MRRLIAENADYEGYNDEPENEPAGKAPEVPSGDQDHGPRVEPSPLIEHGNEWREEGEASRT